MKIGFDAKRYYHNNTGLGNYSRTIVSGLKNVFPEDEHILYDEKSFTRTFRLGSKAGRDGCDLFHGLSNELPVDIKIPSVLTMHDVAWRTFPDMYHFADRHIYDIKYGSSCRRATRIVAISESTKRDVMRFYGVEESRVQVIYQPVQEYYYTPLTEEEAVKLIDESGLGIKDYLLYVGSINSRKNLLSAVKALELLPEQDRPLLLVIGNGREYRTLVEEYIAKHNLQRWIRIESGIHNNSLLQALYRQAIAFVYPSFYEGFGLPVVEAALQHTPVITTTVSSLPEAAGPDACLIDPHSPEAAEHISEYMKRLITDADYNEGIAAKMEEYARRMFTPETLTHQMKALYEDII